MFKDKHDFIYLGYSEVSSGDKTLFINYRDSKLTRLLQVWGLIAFKGWIISNY